MKIMWITNIVIGSIHQMLYGRASNGFWMDALLKDFISEGEHELLIVTTGRNKKHIYLEKKNVKYYIFPGGYPFEYNHENKRNMMDWERLIQKEKPDIIQVWGSEYTHGLAALRVAPNIPSVIFIQGILAAIAKYYEAGINYKELKKNRTIRDIIKGDSVLSQKNKYLKNSNYEKELLKLSGNIISENLWTVANCKEIISDIKVYYCPLNINDVFSEYRWIHKAIKPHTIMCNASGYPLKGLHMILEALYLVKQEYPNVRLTVPGNSMISDKSIKGKLKKSGYMKYIERQIERLGLSDNIEFTGKVTPREMAKRMSKVNVFVLSSAIENQSSTLKEAMMVGTPCIASSVGGIPEYASHEKNALLYRFEEYELLAEYISIIFRDEQFASRLSINALEEINKLHDHRQIYKKVINIYTDMVNTEMDLQ
ncbi:glycosyltransferase family 4 protein [Sporosarcina ureae]|uniref:glycosyltransferase family 4 protein n=1 Tax=Sporosarcina ureae TaxID=1571 RepID=UPI0026EB48D4|nr:glycosyltransferase family 4 protein [Sporosarcina ureae]